MNRLVRTELLKLRTTRAFWMVLAATLAITVIAVVGALTIAGRDGAPPQSGGILHDVVGMPGAVLSGVVVLLGVLGASGEFRHRTISATGLITALGRRQPVPNPP